MASAFWHFWGITFQLKLLLFWLRITDEGSVPQKHIWSILFIKSDLKLCIHLGRRLFFIFQLHGECHCWWTSKSPRAHVAKHYDRLQLIRNVSGASKLFVLKLIEIVILWVYYTIPSGFSFLTVLGHHFPIFHTTFLAEDH